MATLFALCMLCYFEPYGFQLIYAGMILLASDDNMALISFGCPLAIGSLMDFRMIGYWSIRRMDFNMAFMDILQFLFWLLNSGLAWCFWHGMLGGKWCVSLQLLGLMKVWNRYARVGDL